MRAFHYVVVIVSCAFGVACGGGGGGGSDAPPGDPVHAKIDGLGSADGVLTSTGYFFTSGSDALPAVGEGSDGGRRLRQVFAFSLLGLPEGARIVRAELAVEQFRVWGEPYLRFGDIVVDCVRGTPELTWDGGDLVRDLGTLSSGPGLGMRFLDVTQGVRASYGLGLTRCHLRARFDPGLPGFPDGETDLVAFGDGEGTYTDVAAPVLDVYYYP